MNKYKCIYIHIYIFRCACVYIHICKSNNKCGNLEVRGTTKTEKSSKVEAPERRQSMFLFLRMQESIFRLRKQNPCITVTYLYSTSHSLISPRVIGRLNFLRHEEAVPSNIFIFLTRKSRD